MVFDGLVIPEFAELSTRFVPNIELVDEVAERLAGLSEREDLGTSIATEL
jgi:hypothetical protein